MSDENPLPAAGCPQFGLHPQPAAAVSDVLVPVSIGYRASPVFVTAPAAVQLGARRGMFGMFGEALLGTLGGCAVSNVGDKARRLGVVPRSSAAG